ncbi:MAG: magnesium transporter [Baekduia sp.]
MPAELDDPQLLDAAAAHCTRDVPIAAPASTAGETRRELLGGSYEFAGDIAVLDGERFAGLLAIERLIGAPEEALVSGLMDADVPRVAPGVDQERAAHRLIEHGQSAIPVVGDDDRFIGLIPPVRMLEVLLREHDEDMARIGGFTTGHSSARRAAEEPVGARLLHRLPWLLIGLAGAMLAAVIVGRYEEEIASQVLLASFLPGVVYIADAVGTQTEAIVIRGMSAGVRIPDVAFREVLTGAFAGVLIAACFIPLAALIWGEPDIALGVGLGLLAACSIATIVAMALPWLFEQLGIDAAFGSGPLATVLQDLLSILVYFAIAVPLSS